MPTTIPTSTIQVRISAYANGGNNGSSPTTFQNNSFPVSNISITSFALSNTLVANSEIVSLNGLLLTTGTDYTVNGTSIILTNSVVININDIINVKYASASSATFHQETAVVVAMQTTYTPNATIKANSETISINGVTLSSTIDYTVSSNVILFSTGVINTNDLLTIHYQS